MLTLEYYHATNQHAINLKQKVISIIYLNLSNDLIFSHSVRVGTNQTIYSTHQSHKEYYKKTNNSHKQMYFYNSKLMQKV